MPRDLRTTAMPLFACASVAAALGLARAHQSDSKTSAEAAACVANCKQLAMGMLMYAQDYDEKYPPMKRYAKFQNVIVPYVKNRQIFTCPATKKPYAVNSNMSQKPMAALKNPSKTPAIFDAVAHTDGTYAVAYADGRVKREKKIPPKKL